MTDVLQGSPEWFAARLGKVTASRVSDVCARTKSGYSASRANYMSDLIIERLTGQPIETFTNSAMQWGLDKEPEARAAYEFLTDRDVKLAGFVDHPTIAMCGASPDGFVDGDGLVEIKCPNTATHIETLLGAQIDRKYLLQMQWQMACTGRKWCDFVSYDPRLPEPMRMHVQRIERDDKLIAEIAEEVVAFLDELAAKIKKLTELYA